MRVIMLTGGSRQWYESDGIGESLDNQIDRVFVVRHPDLFESLRQTADGHIVHAAIGQSLRRGHDLRMAAVDDDQIRDVGEMMPVRVLLDDSRVPYAVRRRCRRRGCGCIGRFGTALVVHAVAGVAGDVAVSEPSRQRLVKGAQINPSSARRFFVKTPSKPYEFLIVRDSLNQR